MRQLVILLFTISLLYNSEILAQKRQVRFDKISVDDGIPEGNILDILQDSKGYIWICSYEGLYKHNGLKITPADQGSNGTTLSTNRASCITEDKDKNLWVGTYIGLNKIESVTGKIIQYKNTNDTLNTLPGNRIYNVFADSNNDIWVNTDKGIGKYNKETDNFQKIDYLGGYVFTYCFFEDGHGRIWLGTSKGLYNIDKKTSTVYQILNTKNQLTGQKVFNIYRDNNNIIWLCTSIGLLTLDENNSSIHSASLLPYENPKKIIRRIVQDKNNDYWLSTNTQLLYHETKTNTVSVYKKENGNPESLLSAHLRELYVDNSGNIWIGTDIGLNKINPQSKAFSFYQLFPNAPYNDYVNHIQRIHQNSDGSMLYYNYTDLFYSKKIGDKIKKIEGLPSVFIEHLHNMPNGETWLSYTSPSRGVWGYMPGTNTARKISISKEIDNIPVYQLQTDIDSPWICWIATTKGLYTYNLRTKLAKPVPIKHSISKTYPIVRRFLQSKDGHLWIAAGSVLLSYNKNTQETIEYTNTDKKPCYPNSRVRDIIETSDGKIWFATQTGLYTYDSKVEKFKLYTTNNGLRGGNIIYSISSDNNNNIWLATFNHIIKFIPKTELFEYYSIQDGIYTTFNRLSSCNLKSGHIVFGGTNGFVSFNPDSIKHSNNTPPVVISSISINNKPYLSDTLAEYLKNISYRYDENSITIEFSALEYVSSEKNLFSYKLEGYDKDWINAGTNNKATYTNLNPGTYKFIVRTSNYSGKWSNKTAELLITVKPLFWQELWFKIVIIIIVIMLLYYLWKNDNEKRRLKHEKELAIQNEKYKTHFLNNISHEIRTPLNAIIGLNKLLLDSPLNKQQYKYTDAAVKSSQTLFTLINDLLDQAKIESGQFRLTTTPFEPRAILTQVYNAFLHAANEKELYLKLVIDENIPDNVLGDAIRLHQILSNLTSNAIKYTQKGGVEISTITTIIDTVASITFIVKDTGIGIEKDKTESVFESFKQIDNADNTTQIGTGLGLSICKQLVELQGGYITVYSIFGTGSTFKFTLDYKLALSDNKSTQENSKVGINIKPINILLVEDTPFNQLLTIEILKKNIKGATITVAENGKEALGILMNRKDFDIILMDIKMPVMNGYDTSEAIRKMNDDYFKSIPILALTANAIPEQLEQCKKSGMNGWVTKPLNDQLLLKKIAILIKNI